MVVHSVKMAEKDESTLDLTSASLKSKQRLITSYYKVKSTVRSMLNIA